MRPFHTPAKPALEWCFGGFFPFSVTLVLAESELRNGDMQSTVMERVVGGVEVPYHSSWPWQVQQNGKHNLKKFCDDEKNGSKRCDGEFYNIFTLI